MSSTRHHQESKVDVAPAVSPLFSRLVAGTLGGLLLTYIAGGVCGLALADPIRDADSEGITPGGVVLLIAMLGILVHSVVFAVRSRRTARVWRILILRSSAAAFATPLGVIVALVRLALRSEHMSMGPIVYFYAGAVGLVGGVVLRVIGLRIARTPVPTPEPELPVEPDQRCQKAAGSAICPACGAALLQMACDDLVLDVCRNGCGGIWFDNFELRQATDSIRSMEKHWLPRTTASSRDHVDPSPKRPCPKCAGIKMIRHLFSDSCPIEVDECPSCGGIWVDSGEFEQIQASLDQQEASTPRTAFDPETAMLMANLESQMKQAHQQTQARRGLCKFIGRRYCTPYRNCEL